LPPWTVRNCEEGGGNGSPMRPTDAAAGSATRRRSAHRSRAPPAIDFASGRGREQPRACVNSAGGSLEARSAASRLPSRCTPSGSRVGMAAQPLRALPREPSGWSRTCGRDHEGRSRARHDLGTEQSACFYSRPYFRNTAPRPNWLP
jgi:hypothetical protein